MTIPAEIYTNLSPAERIRATVLAEARNDEEELQILKKTCPKRTFLMTDPDYSEGMANLHAVVFNVEHELAMYALEFQMTRSKNREMHVEIQDYVLKAAATVVMALNQLFEEMGLDPQAMAKIAPLRHPLVSATLIISAGEADPDQVEVRLQQMREYLVT